MHHIIKGYKLANEEYKKAFADAVKDGQFNVSVLDLGGSYLIPESVKWISELYFNAVNQYTDGVLIEFENDYTLGSLNTKYFVEL